MREEDKNCFYFGEKEEYVEDNEIILKKKLALSAEFGMNLLKENEELREKFKNQANAYSNQMDVSIINVVNINLAIFNRTTTTKNFYE